MASRFGSREEAQLWLSLHCNEVAEARLAAHAGAGDVVQKFHDFLLKQGAAIGAAQALHRVGWINDDQYAKALAVLGAQVVAKGLEKET